MNFLARIFRYLFWLLIVSWGATLLKRIVVGMLRYAAGVSLKQQRPVAATAPDSMPETQVGSRRLVRDPVCGMHIAEVLAIPLREEAELVHFCSTTCRDAYLGNTRKMAANG
ncbi:MAG TPA: hypothetical protein VK525_22255 [Candidatus Saccharimonadales bacterium]|jgi:YHS domain-containing protein|nr:hypothetical protein [Candidatus Saccharimonadales bacterium]